MSDKQAETCSAVPAVKWDKRYRMLKEGEIIQEGDECLTDSKKGWQPARHTVGKPAPDPNYTSHRIYRRLDGVWMRIGNDPALSNARRKLSMRELRIIIRHALGFSREQAALSASPVPVVAGVKVKPLEWPNREPNTRLTCKPIGPYCYTIVLAGECVYRWCCTDVWVRADAAPYGHSPDGRWSDVCRTLDGAKAAAQADYEQRILSCITNEEPGS